MKGVNMNFDRHFFLYAKLHYEIGDIMEDLKTMVSARSGIDRRYVKTDLIVELLLGVAYPYIKYESDLAELALSALPSSWSRIARAPQVGSEYPVFEKDIAHGICGYLLKVLGYTKVCDIPFDLGEADPNILPLRKK
jgi:hypothetical protein